MDLKLQEEADNSIVQDSCDHPCCRKLESEIKELKTEVASLRSLLAQITAQLAKLDDPEETPLKSGDKVFNGPPGTDFVWIVTQKAAEKAAEKEDICSFADSVFKSGENLVYSSYSYFPEEMQNVVNYMIGKYFSQ